MEHYLDPLVHLFESNRNPYNAGLMENYMRGKFPFLGIQSPLRRTLFRKFVAGSGLPGPDQLPGILIDLWQLPEREYQMAGLDLRRNPRKFYPGISCRFWSSWFWTSPGGIR
jgi:DNA alkylation repair enzyme.